MTHGKFDPRIPNIDSLTILSDVFVSLVVMRGTRGAETLVAQFKGRITNTTSSSVGRDHQGEIASTGSIACVIIAPSWLQIQRGDEIWTPDRIRYRVTAIDSYPGHQQIIAEQLQ